MICASQRRVNTLYIGLHKYHAYNSVLALLVQNTVAIFGTITNLVPGRFSSEGWTVTFQPYSLLELSQNSSLDDMVGSKLKLADILDVDVAIEEIRDDLMAIVICFGGIAVVSWHLGSASPRTELV